MHRQIIMHKAHYRHLILIFSLAINYYRWILQCSTSEGLFDREQKTSVINCCVTGQTFLYFPPQTYHQNVPRWFQMVIWSLRMRVSWIQLWPKWTLCERVVSSAMFDCRYTQHKHTGCQTVMHKPSSQSVKHKSCTTGDKMINFLLTIQCTGYCNTLALIMCVCVWESCQTWRLFTFSVSSYVSITQLWESVGSLKTCRLLENM